MDYFELKQVPQGRQNEAGAEAIRAVGGARVLAFGHLGGDAS